MQRDPEVDSEETSHIHNVLCHAYLHVLSALRTEPKYSVCTTTDRVRDLQCM